jgi:predicted RNA binding protein YcfA (HicA-like mRNA interferase family)
MAILGDQGFVQVRRRGSHVSMQKVTAEGTRTAIMPDHKQVAIGTLRSIIRQSGLPRELFER